MTRDAMRHQAVYSVFDKLGTWPDDFTGLIVYLY